MLAGQAVFGSGQSENVVVSKDWIGKKCQTPFVRNTRWAGSRQKGSDTYFPLVSKTGVFPVIRFGCRQLIVSHCRPLSQCEMMNSLVFTRAHSNPSIPEEGISDSLM